MNTPHVVGSDAKDNQGQAIRLTVSTDIVDYFEATRVFGREGSPPIRTPMGASSRASSRCPIVVPRFRARWSSPSATRTICSWCAATPHMKAAGPSSISTRRWPRRSAARRACALGAAATDDDRITVAVAVDDGPRSRVFVAYDLSSKTTEWSKVPWIDCGVRDSVRVEGVRVLDNGDKSWTIVLAGQNGPNEAVYLLQSGGAHSFATALVFNPAVTLEEILDFEAGVHPTYGSGLHVLGVGGGKRTLSFRPFPVYDASGRPTTIPLSSSCPAPRAPMCSTRDRPAPTAPISISAARARLSLSPPSSTMSATRK